MNEVKFPVEIFPEIIQDYILQSNDKLNMPIDFLCCTFLWEMAVMIGNSMEVKVKNGWTERVNLWVILIGERGISKSPPISHMIRPLINLNKKEIQKYHIELEKFEAWEKMDKAQQKEHGPQKRPITKQFIFDDSTIESLVKDHGNNPLGIGIMDDEIKGWVERTNMAKTVGGGEREKWLKIWSGKHVYLNRKVAESSFVHNPCVPILGGIQPEIIQNCFDSKSEDSGFVDRFLMAYPDVKREYINENEITDECMDNFDSCIENIYYSIRENYVQFDSFGEVMPYVAKFSPRAKELYFNISRKMTDLENNPEIDLHMKGFYPKQKSYIPRIALILNVANYFINGSNSGEDIQNISDRAMIGAIKLFRYFEYMFSKQKVDTQNHASITNITDQRNKSTKEKMIEILQLNPDIKMVKLAKDLKISRTQCYNIKNEIAQDEQGRVLADKDLMLYNDVINLVTTGKGKFADFEKTEKNGKIYYIRIK